MRTVDVDSLLAPYPDEYYSQQSQYLYADDRIFAVAPSPYNNATPRRRRTGNCTRCGAPIYPYKEKCDYCDFYYD